jgi:hypothetical protein
MARCGIMIPSPPPDALVVAILANYPFFSLIEHVPLFKACPQEEAVRSRRPMARRVYLEGISSPVAGKTTKYGATPR